MWCPVPSQGSLLDPRSQAQKGRLVRKARPSQAAGLPHFARVRTGLFPFIFLFQDLSCQLLYFNSTLILFSKFSGSKSQGPLSLVVVYPSTRPSVRPVSALEMLPGPDIEQILEALPLLGDHTIPYHTISFLGRPDKKQWRTKGRMVAGDMADQETKSEENQQNKDERRSW